MRGERTTLLNLGVGRPISGRRRPWRGDGPARTRERGVWEFANGRPPHWAQHLFRFISDDGREFFVGLPRDLDEGDLRDLAALGDGWHVWLAAVDAGKRGPVLQVAIELIEQADARRSPLKGAA